jgi:hypothetical protein
VAKETNIAQTQIFVFFGIFNKLLWRGGGRGQFHAMLFCTIINKTSTYASETWILTKRDKKQIKIFEGKVYRRILGPVYDNNKENWRTLTLILLMWSIG